MTTSRFTFEICTEQCGLEIPHGYIIDVNSGEIALLMVIPSVKHGKYLVGNCLVTKQLTIHEAQVLIGQFSGSSLPSECVDERIPQVDDEVENYGKLFVMKHFSLTQQKESIDALYSLGLISHDQAKQIPQAIGKFAEEITVSRNEEAKRLVFLSKDERAMQIQELEMNGIPEEEVALLWAKIEELEFLQKPTK